MFGEEDTRHIFNFTSFHLIKLDPVDRWWIFLKRLRVVKLDI